MAQKRKSLLYSEECKPLTQTQVDDIKQQFNPLNTANVLIIDPASRPNTWPENTEIDLGGGLYGYRATGNMPEIAIGGGGTIFQISFSFQPLLCDIGGNYEIYNNNNSRAIIRPYGVSFSIDGTISSEICLIVQGDNLVVCFVKLNTPMKSTTLQTYDIWFTYTK